MTEKTSHLSKTYKKLPVDIERGKGSLVFDREGKAYIDLGAQTGVNLFGASDEIWLAAVEAQLEKIAHISNSYLSSPQLSLAETICKKTGADNVFFSNSGAEANECAVKAARKYSAEKYGGKRNVIATLKNSFHGRTISMLAATGQPRFHRDFAPFTPGFLYVDPEKPDELFRAAKSGKLSAVMIECVRGEGGVLPLPQEFAEAIKEVKKDFGILLICDEVQCGTGRCGKFFAYENYGLSPDIVTMAKGLGGGLPIGATLFFGETKDTFGIGDHGSTFGGNACACAGAETIVSRIDEVLLAEVNRKSALVFSALNGARGVRSVRGKGLMIGIETDPPSERVMALCAACNYRKRLSAALACTEHSRKSPRARNRNNQSRTCRNKIKNGGSENRFLRSFI